MRFLGNLVNTACVCYAWVLTLVEIHRLKQWGKSKPEYQKLHNFGETPDFVAKLPI